MATDRRCRRAPMLEEARWTKCTPTCAKPPRRAQETAALRPNARTRTSEPRMTTVSAADSVAPSTKIALQESSGTSLPVKRRSQRNVATARSTSLRNRTIRGLENHRLRLNWTSRRLKEPLQKHQVQPVAKFVTHLVHTTRVDEAEITIVETWQMITRPQTPAVRYLPLRITGSRILNWCRACRRPQPDRDR